MKTRIAIVALFASVVWAMAGPSAPSTFNPAITRQDFTGQGTYHRIGLVREQQRAIAAQTQTSTSPTLVKVSRPGCLARLWQSLFSRKASTPPTP